MDVSQISDIMIAEYKQVVNDTAGVAVLEDVKLVAVCIIDGKSVQVNGLAARIYFKQVWRGCPACEGTGVNPNPDGRFNPTCRICHGSGRLYL